MSAAIEIGPGIWRVPTTPFDLVNSYLIRSADDSFALVDTGVRFAPPRIRAALDELRITPADVTTIVLTHAHSDHAGGAASLSALTGTGMTVHVGDAEYMRTGTLPPNDPGFRLGRISSWIMPRIAGLDPAPVSRTMVDGELLEGPGLRVHHTPGHTMGHCSLLHERSGTLITGDSIWNMRSRRTWPALAFCTNAAMSQQTAGTLADLEYTTAAFTHGPEIRRTGREAVREFLAHPRRFAPGV